MNSASVELGAVTVCVLHLYFISPPAIITQKPVVERRLRRPLARAFSNTFQIVIVEGNNSIANVEAACHVCIE